MTNQKDATYVDEGFVMIKNKKKNINYTEKLEIMIISQENLNGQLMAFVI